MFNDLLTSRQSGFRPGQFTQDLLLHITDDWRHTIVRKHLVGAVFLDLKKAFDCVNHEIFLRKLCLQGVKGKAYHSLKDYLSDRV